MNSTSSIATLYIVQTQFARIPALITELNQLVGTNDQIVLLEDSVFALQQDACLNLMTHHTVSVLETDIELIPQQHVTRVQIIDYLKFAQLIAQANKVLTWK